MEAHIQKHLAVYLDCDRYLGERIDYYVGGKQDTGSCMQLCALGSS